MCFIHSNLDCNCFERVISRNCFMICCEMIEIFTTYCSYISSIKKDSWFQCIIERKGFDFKVILITFGSDNQCS